MGRLHYISENLGLRWADGSAATLRGEFHLPPDQLESFDSVDGHISMLMAPGARNAAPKPAGRYPLISFQRLAPEDRPLWVKQVEAARSGPVPT